MHMIVYDENHLMDVENGYIYGVVAKENINNKVDYPNNIRVD